MGDFNIGDYAYSVEVVSLDKNGNACLCWRHNAHYLRFLFKRFIVDKIRGDELFEENNGIFFKIFNPKSTVLEALKDAGYKWVTALKVRNIAEDEYNKSDPTAKNLWLDVYVNRYTGQFGLTFNSVRGELTK
jgi:hypothetical protein